MPERVAIVTDSTAYLPAGLAESLGIVVVPLRVILDGAARLEGPDGPGGAPPGSGPVTPAELAAALRPPVNDVSTSRPSPHTFREAYRQALTAGATAVLSVHLSAELSGTVEAARLAAADVPGDIRVLDSRSTAMGLGFPVLAAAQCAAAGGGVEEVAGAAADTVTRTTTLFYVDTLEHLRRGGRIGAAQAWLGTALSVKPLLHVHEGRIVPLEKVRTTTRAVARLEEHAVRAAGGGACWLSVQHLAAPAPAAALAERLRARLRPDAVHLSEVGAVVGAHVGPGLLGVVVVRR